MDEDNAENIKLDADDVSAGDMKCENDTKRSESFIVSSPTILKRNSILKPKNNDDVSVQSNEIVSNEITDHKSDSFEQSEFSIKKTKQNSNQVSHKIEVCYCF